MYYQGTTATNQAWVWQMREAEQVFGRSHATPTAVTLMKTSVPEKSTNFSRLFSLIRKQDMVGNVIPQKLQESRRSQYIRLPLLLAFSCTITSKVLGNIRHIPMEVIKYHLVWPLKHRKGMNCISQASFGKHPITQSAALPYTGFLLQYMK